MWNIAEIEILPFEVDQQGSTRDPRSGGQGLSFLQFLTIMWNIVQIKILPFEVDQQGSTRDPRSGGPYLPFLQFLNIFDNNGEYCRN